MRLAEMLIGFLLIASWPGKKRQALAHTLVTDMMIAEAPPDLIQAAACLMDDAIAEKACEAIFNCRRGES